MSKVAFLLKFVFVVVFMSLVYYAIDYFIAITISKIDLPITDLLCYLGVIRALNILVSISIASYVANQLIAYFRS